MKTTFTTICLLFVFILNSCYNVKIAVGDADYNGPVYKVNSEMNHHLLWGLVPLSNTKMKGSAYVNGHTDYVIKTNQTFLDGFLNVLTFGIYSPTTTSYYLPIPENGVLYSGMNTNRAKKSLYTSEPEQPVIPEYPQPAVSQQIQDTTPEIIDEMPEVKPVVYNIYFRNGAKIEAEITERTDIITTVKTKEGKINRYRNSDISRIEKQ